MILFHFVMSTRTIKHMVYHHVMLFWWINVMIIFDDVNLTSMWSIGCVQGQSQLPCDVENRLSEHSKFHFFSLIWASGEVWSSKSYNCSPFWRCWMKSLKFLQFVNWPKSRWIGVNGHQKRLLRNGAFCMELVAPSSKSSETRHSQKTIHSLGSHSFHLLLQLFTQSWQYTRCSIFLVTENHSSAFLALAFSSDHFTAYV